MKQVNFFSAIALAVFLCAGLLSFSQEKNPQRKNDAKTTAMQQKQQEAYSCPMHPDVVSDKPGKCLKCGMNLEKQATKGLRPRRGEPSRSSMMGKPTFEKSVDGVNLQVWLITQTEHKKMMKDHGMMGGGTKRHMMHGNTVEGKDHQMMNDQMQHDAKDIDEVTMKSMLAGTHHIMAVVEDEASKTERESAEIEVQIVSPTEKNSTATLTHMMKHYGGGLTLDEQGEYRITVVVRDGDKVMPASFAYGVTSTK